jgi:(S)-ureidoglycine-glyoxylate aminotransferase
VRRRYEELNPPPRLLLGAGAANPDPRVQRALTAPPLGPLDPAFALLLDDVQELTRYAFRTANLRSFPVLGTARVGVETLLASLVEDGDRVLVGVSGAAGARLADVALRYGAAVETVETDWGRALEPEALLARLRARPPKLVLLIHVEPTTGVVQPLAEVARACIEHDALLVVDAALSLGACEASVDAWRLDACVGGLGRGLGGVAGLAPLTYNGRVEAALGRRRAPPRAGCLDLGRLQDYWSPAHLQLYALPAPLVYAAREALRLVHTEGLERRWRRHRRVGEALAAGLEALGLRLLGAPAERAPHLAVVQLPASLVEARVRQQLLADYGIEISAGLGRLYGRTWRIGLMGYNARLEHALTLLAALEQVLAAHGYPVLPHIGVDAAQARYTRGG